MGWSKLQVQNSNDEAQNHNVLVPNCNIQVQNSNDEAYNFNDQSHNCNNGVTDVTTEANKAIVCRFYEEVLNQLGVMPMSEQLPA